jgi:hypothetical protein
MVVIGAGVVRIFYVAAPFAGVDCNLFFCMMWQLCC